MDKDFFKVLSGALFFIGFLPYAYSVLRKGAKPSKASWTIWASLDSITLTGMYFKQALNGQIIGAVAGAWGIVVLALKYGVPGWTKLDKRCLAGAVFGIVLWQAFDDPTLAILTSNSVVFLGSFPTFKSAWVDPDQEDRIAWTIWWVSCICALVAIPGLTLEELAHPWVFLVSHPDDAVQPITFFLIETIMMYLLHIRPRRAYA